MALDNSHVPDPVDARCARDIARKAKRQGSCLLPMFVRNSVPVLDMGDCG